jgi:hypothetical protein
MAGMRVLQTSRIRIPCFVNDRFIAYSGPSQRGNFEMRMGGNFLTRRGGKFETRNGGKVDANMQMGIPTATLAYYVSQGQEHICHASGPKNAAPAGDGLPEIP